MTAGSSGFLPSGSITPESWALACGQEELSWVQTCDLVTRLGNVFLSQVASGRIAIVGDNSNPTVLSHVAALINGFSSVGVNPKLTSEEMAYIFRDSQAGLVIASPGSREAATTAAASLGIPVLSWPGEFHYGDLHWDSEIAQASPTWIGADLPAQAPVLYTSGTSGFPSGTEVQWTDEIGSTVTDVVKNYQNSLKTFPQGPHIVVGPLYHNGPLLAMRMILAGRSVVIMPKFDAQKALELIDEKKVESSVVVPTHLVRFMNLDEEIKSAYDVSSMKSIRLTGAACPVAVKEGIMNWFGEIVTESYGGTETHAVASISGTEARVKPGSVGRTTPRWTVLVVDDEGHEVPTGESGRLFFVDKYGRGVTFLNNPEKTAAANLRPGVCTVGDIGYVDEDGYIFLNDRSVDMVISGGVNIYPAECERVLITHPAVGDIAAVGLPDDDMGERLVGVVVLKPGVQSPTVAELDQFCRDHLAPYKCPKEYRFMSSTGRNAIGKVNKRQLRDALLSDNAESHLAINAGR